MIVVLTFILIGGFCYDIRGTNNQPIRKNIEGAQNSTLLLTAITIFSFILLILTVGEALFNPVKSEMMEDLNRWHILMVQSASIGAVISFIQKRKFLFAICMFMLIFNIYIGFRSTTAIVVISIFLYSLWKQGKQRLLIQNFKMIVLGGFIAIFFFSYKNIYSLIKAGEYSLAFERLTSLDYYINSISYSEPFATQLVLNEVVNQNFKVGVEHFAGIINHLVLFAGQLGAEITDFNSLFQPVLFPNVTSGMASNIWAEMWSSGGWPLLILFLVIFTTVLFFGSRLLNISDSNIQGLVLLSMTYWAFYIHRNTLYYQINLEKRVLIVWIVAVVISILLSYQKNKNAQLNDINKNYNKT